MWIWLHKQVYKLALVHVKLKSGKSGIFSFLVRSRRCATRSCGRDTPIAGRRFLKRTTAIAMNECSSTVCELRPGFKPLIHSLLFWLGLQKLIDKISNIIFDNRCVHWLNHVFPLCTENITQSCHSTVITHSSVQNASANAAKLAEWAALGKVCNPSYPKREDLSY